MDGTTLAPIHRRLAAGAIDEVPKLLALGGAVGYVLALGTPSLAYGFAALGVVASAACFANVVVLPALYGWSLGCRAAGIRIIPTDRVRERGIGFLPAFVRASVLGGLSWIFLLGYVWYWVDPRRRMWHDLLAATLVVDVGSPTPAPSVSRSLARQIAALVLAALGYVTKLPVILVIVAQGLFISFVPNMIAPIEYAHSKVVPADLPQEVVVADEDRIVDVAVADLGSGTKRTVITWEGLSGDAVTALLAWKLGFDIQGFKTEVDYTSTGSRVIFSRDGAYPISGMVTAMPTEDEKDTKSMIVQVDYRAGTAATSTP